MTFKQRKNYSGACKFIYHWHNMFTFELYFYEPYHRKVEKNRKHYPFFNYRIRTFGSSVPEAYFYTSDDSIDILWKPYNNSMETVKEIVFQHCVKKSLDYLEEILYTEGRLTIER